jgi:hypothetical protein
MKDNTARLVINALLVFGICATTWAGTWPASVGVYHWGAQPPRTVSQGVQQIVELGGRTARIALSPKYYIDYGSGVGCYANFSLKAAAVDTELREALDNPNVDVFMLTAYDGTSFGDCIHHKYLSPSFYTAENTAALIQEYSDFTLYLYDEFQHSHKRFIISNWESDNDVYCGDAYGYATNQLVREACNAAYPAAYLGNTSPEQSLDGLKRWFSAREQGIEDGRNRAAAQGLGGMRVFFAPEISIVHLLHDAGFKSVLYDVVPTVIFDYVSYSAYESINQANPGTVLTADLNTVQEVTGSSSIILGEIGFSRLAWGSDAAVSRTDQVVTAALSWGVTFIFIWNLYDQNPQNTFGLVDAAGALTALGLYFDNQLGPTP